MAARARDFRAVHVDFGTGDGTWVVRSARAEPDVLFVGVDAIAENLRRASRLAPENAIFGRLALEALPGELEALADRLTVLFPWGSLLRAVETAEPESLRRLRRLCRPGAEVRFVFETPDGRALERAHRDAGFDVRARPLAVEAAREIPTTWAKKLGYSGRPRSFWELRGRAV